MASESISEEQVTGGEIQGDHIAVFQYLKGAYKQEGGCVLHAL